MNISEFAQVAGVSKSAVSRYFNDGYLSEEKRKKIEKAIAKTGYSPSVTASSASIRVTKLVGVIMPKLSSESCAKVTEGISEILDAEGYQLLLVNTANDYHKEIESLELFRQNRVDGVILLASVFTDLHKSVLHKMHVPVIITGQSLKGFSCVCHNDYGAAYGLTKLMIEKGCKSPGAIGVTEEDLSAGKSRWDGFKAAVRDAGLDVKKEFCELAQFTMESGYEHAKRIFSGANIPDCLFCATDNIAAGAILYCRENGIKIPEQVMVASVGGSKVGKLSSVPITTAHLHYRTAGREAAKMLLSAMRRRDAVQRTLQLDYDIIERESTKKV